MAAESGEELGELLMFRMTLQVNKNFHAGAFISQIDQADRSQVSMLQGPTLALSRGDGHAQRGTIALPRHDNRG